jgi:superfamily I DNA/RNA helicase
MPVAAPEVSFHDRYFRSLGDLQPREAAQVNQALLQFRDDPNHPSLNLHPVNGAARGFMSVRASQELRVIVYQRGSTFIWLFADHHDRAYDRAGRMRMVIDPEQGMQIVGVDAGQSTEPATLGSTALSADTPGVELRRPLDHWTDAELQQAGFAPDEIVRLRSLRSAEEALDLIGEWPEERIEQVLDMVEVTPEAFLAPQLDPTAAEEAAENRLRDAIVRHGTLAGLSKLFDPDELERIASAPIEEWMLFLHPDQQVLVDREFNGPARVRGAAGTGKTVVLLHRAAALSRRYSEPEDRILVTTYIRSLPPVLEQLVRRLPAADADRIDFLNVDKLAHQICTEADQRPRFDPAKVDAALAAAWRTVVTAGSPLDRAGVTRQYAREEITSVIKGRGIGDLDTYLDLRRTGRRTKFGDALREHVWALKEAWDDGMLTRGVEDFHDVVIRARDLARNRTAPTYRVVLVDEAQDLTLVALQLVRSLANGPGEDRPDGLFIAGDGAQRIYPGGFTLRQAGVEVRGRTAVLTVNYRNTAEVIDAAMAVAGAEEVEDLDEDYRRSDEASFSGRSGVPVELLIAPDVEAELPLVAARVQELLDTEAGLGAGDVAVCASTNRTAKAVRRALDDAGISSQDLADYDGRPNHLVKVGTHHRAKGLEFKVVVLPGLSDGVFPHPQLPGTDDQEYADQRALDMSSLFVAMTRARDRLILSCGGAPNPVLDPILDRLDRRTPDMPSSGRDEPTDG